MKDTLYHRLYEKLEKQIIEGQFKEGDKFYSKGQLSRRLSISQTIVEHAYQLLLDGGYIYSRPRSGYFVSEIESLIILNNQPIPSLFNDDLYKPKASDEAYNYAFNLDEIDTKHFPIELFGKYFKDLYDINHLNRLRGGHSQGELHLWFRLAFYLFTSHGVICDPNQITVGSSTEQLINQLADLLCTSTFIIEKPSYPPIKGILGKKWAEYEQVEVEGSGMNVDEVTKSQKNVVYIMPSHQLPIGYIVGLRKRIQLIQWAQEKEERFVIEDGYGSEFRYFGKPIPATQGLYSGGEKVVYISTFSRSVFPSRRVVYIVLPYSIMKEYHSQGHIEGSTVPVHTQNLIATFISSGGFGRHLNKMRQAYRRKLTYILKRLKPYKEQLDIQGVETDMHFIITVRNGLTLQECLDRTSKVKLGLQIYNFDGDQDHKEAPEFILSFGGIDDDALKPRIDALIKSLIMK